MDAQRGLGPSSPLDGYKRAPGPSPASVGKNGSGAWGAWGGTGAFAWGSRRALLEGPATASPPAGRFHRARPRGRAAPPQRAGSRETPFSRAPALRAGRSVAGLRLTLGACGGGRACQRQFPRWWHA